VPEPKAAGGTHPTLTAGEQGALERVRAEGNVRLEQERIAWGFALAQLASAAETKTAATKARGPAGAYLLVRPRPGRRRPSTIRMMPTMPTISPM
jgi:hypothetical protein